MTVYYFRPIESAKYFIGSHVLKTQTAAKELMRNYDDHVVGKVMSKIFAHHSETDTCYTLDEEDRKGVRKYYGPNITDNSI